MTKTLLWNGVGCLECSCVFRHFLELVELVPVSKSVTVLIHFTVGVVSPEYVVAKEHYLHQS